MINNEYKFKILKILHIFKNFGLDLIAFFNALRSLPNYFYDLFLFKKTYKGVLNFLPCLADRYDCADGKGLTSEYFWQDLIVARLIKNSAPIKHVDIGSRIDGFVAHVASFREIEIFDIRPIYNAIPNVLVKKIDVMDKISMSKLCEHETAYCDSLSCLHAIEHFGLGRYGDKIHHNGYQQGLENMIKLLKPCGTFYLSTPIGNQRVEFNANWIFDPRTIIKVAVENKLKLKSLSILKQNEFYEVDLNERNFLKLAQQNYNLGLFIFIKQ
jgi:hypothetical protein